MSISLSNLANSLRRFLTNTGSEIGAWIAPLPSAVSVANAARRHLGYDPALSFVVGAIVELLGFATTNRAADLWEYNQTLRDDEPKAPFWLAGVLVALYVISTIALSVISDLATDVVHYLPAIFPIMALTGTVNVALGRQHDRRVEHNRQAAQSRQAAADKAEADRKQREAEVKADALRREQEAKAEAERKEADRKAEREARRLERKEERKAKADRASIDGSVDASIDRLQAGRAAKKATIVDAMLDAYRVNPHIGDTELGGIVGVTRQTIYNYRTELEGAGRVHKNGNGVEVLE